MKKSENKLRQTSEITSSHRGSVETAGCRGRRIALGLGTWIILACAPFASVALATAPFLEPAPPAELGPASGCLKGELRKYFDEHWDVVLKDLKDTTQKEFDERKAKRTYNLAARTAPFLSAAIACDEIDLFENVIDLYALAYPDLTTVHAIYLKDLPPGYLEPYSPALLSVPTRMWVDMAETRRVGSGSDISTFKVPVEDQLGSAKLVHAIARSIGYIARLPHLMRSPRMGQFAKAYWHIVAGDHFARWVFEGPGEFQPMKGMRCKTRPERYTLIAYFERLAMRDFTGAGGAPSPSYCNALVDRDLILMNTAVEILAANWADPAVAPLSKSSRGEFETLLMISEYLLADRTEPTWLPVGTGGGGAGMVLDLGLMDDHPDYRFGEEDGPFLPYPATSRIVGPSHMGWEFNHTKSLLDLLMALRDHRSTGLLPSLGLDYPAETMLEQLANQVVYAVVDRGGPFPAFRSFMDGSNGWYRVQRKVDGRGREYTVGFCPSCRSDAYYNGGWAALGDSHADIRALNRDLVWMLGIAYTKDRREVPRHLYDEVRDFMRAYYGVRVKRYDDRGLVAKGPKLHGIGNVPDWSVPAERLEADQLRTILAAVVNLGR